MKSRFLFSLLLVTLSTTSLLSAQSPHRSDFDPGIIPPTPAAFKMTTYQAQRPNMYTGTANVNIPLYDIDFDGWKLPLSLSYNATGVRTNEEAGEVGLGWAFNATGVISRTIQGYDDFLSSSSTGHLGYIYAPTVTWNFGYDWLTMHNDPPPNSYYSILAHSGADTQPDIFNYNFFGYSGSFTLSQLAQGAIKVVKVKKDPCSVIFHSGGKWFTVVTPEGFKGEFTVLEKSTTFSSYIQGGQTDRMMCCDQGRIDATYYANGSSGQLRTITSWYLSKITSPRGKIVTFSYDLNADGSSSYLSKSQSFGEMDGVGANQVCLQTVHEHVYLKKIESDEVRVDLTMVPRDDLSINDLFVDQTKGQKFFPVTQKLMRHKYIVINNKFAGMVLRTITLNQSYFNQQYTNGKTGDASPLEVAWMRSRLDRVTIDDQEYQLYYDHGTQGLPKKLTTGVDHFGFANGIEQDNQQLLPPEPPQGVGGWMTTGSVQSDLMKLEYYTQKWSRRVDFTVGRAGLLTRVRYPTRGFSTFDYESHDYLPDQSNANLFREVAQNGATTILGGGARIKAIKDYGVDSVLQLSKSYQYTDLTGYTSGKVMTPLYNRFAYQWFNADGTFNGFNIIHTPVASVPGSNSAEGKLIGYSSVTETVIGAGTDSYKNVYLFENRPNTVLAWNSFAVGYPDLNGQAIRVQNFDSQGHLLQETDNQNYYHTMDSTLAVTYRQKLGPNGEPSSYLLFYQPYAIKNTFNTPYKVITYNVDAANNVEQTEKKLTYNSSYLLKTQQIKTSAGDSVLTQTNRPADYNPTLTYATIKRMMVDSVNIVSPVIEEISYKNNAVIAAKGNLYVYDAAHNKINLAASYNYNPDRGAFSSPADGSSFNTPYETSVNFTSYDPSTGKLLEYTPVSGVTNSFIWGYNGTLPIAQASGLGNAALQAAQTAALSSGTIGTVAYETALRNHANLAGKQVTTYTHTPLVGVTQVTDPAGVKKTYEYDTYNRLKKVRDNDGNILEQYDYHFRERKQTRILKVSATSLEYGIQVPDFFPRTGLPYIKCSTGLSAKSITISNTGEDDLELDTLILPPHYFSSWHGGKMILPPGEFISDTLYFSQLGDTAFQKMTYAGNVVIQSTRTNTDNQNIAVHAIYANRVCNFSVDHTTLNFGVTSGSFVSGSVSLTNNGNATLRLIGMPLNWDGVTPTSGDFSTYTDPNFKTDYTTNMHPQLGENCIGPNETKVLPLYFTPPPPTQNNPVTAKLSFIFDYCPAKKDMVLLQGQKINYIDAKPISFDANPAAVPSFTTPSGIFPVAVHNYGYYDFTVVPTSDNVNFMVSSAPVLIHPGTTQTVNVTYTPAQFDFSTQTAHISFTGDQSNPTQTVGSSGINILTVTGNRTASHTAALNVTSMSFSPPLNTPQSVWVNNTGNDYLYVNTATPVDGPTWSATISGAPVTVLPGGAVSVQIRQLATPTAINNPSIINIGTSSGNLPLSVLATLRTVSLDKGTTWTFNSFTGPTSTQQITVTNLATSNSVLNVSGISFTGGSPSMFSASPTVFNLNPGQSQVVNVTFTSGDFNTYSSTLSVMGNQTAGTWSTAISATRGPLRMIQLAPSSLSFISTFSTQNVTVSNVGDANLTISGSGVTNPNTTDYTATLNPIVLAPNQSTTLSVFLKNANPSGGTTSMTVVSDRNAGLEILSVSATTKVIATSPSGSYSYPSFTGTSSAQNVRIYNNGNTDMNVSSISITNGRFTVAAPTSFSVPHGSYHDVTVTYTPTDFSTQTGTMTINADNTVAGGNTLNLSGTRTQLLQLTASTGLITVKPSSQTGTCYLTNTGNVAISVNSIVNSNTSAFTATYKHLSGGIYVAPTTFPYSLAPGASIEVDVVTATSGVYSSASGTLTVTPSSGSQILISLSRSTF